MYQKYTGIILKKYPFGEADELLTIYTREAGKVRAKAVGVRRIKSKLAGHLQSLNEISFETAGGNRRNSSGSGLPILTSVRALAINNYLRENLRKFAFALVGIETLYRMCVDREANAEIYNHLVDFLKNLGESVEESPVVRRFQLNLLNACGYGVEGLKPDMESEIDKHLAYVLEREIKASRFLDTLT